MFVAAMKSVCEKHHPEHDDVMESTALHCLAIAHCLATAHSASNQEEGTATTKLL